MRKLFSLLLLLLATSFVRAQSVDLDVKTHWSEKGDLAAVKYGVIASIEKLGRWNVVEFGEDYSLWLTDLSRREKGDSIIVEMGIELRTPSLVRNGDLLESRTVRVAYLPHALDSLTTLPEVAAYIDRYARDVAERDRLWQGACTLIATKLGGPMVATLAVGILTAVVDELRHTPTSAELCESTLLSVQALAAIETMVQHQRAQ